MKTPPKSSDPKRTTAVRFLDLSFDPEVLLDLLNRRRNFGMIESRGKNRAPDEDYHATKEILVTELRKLVDAWLDSGRDGQGGEQPLTRRVKTTIPNIGGAKDRMCERTVFDSVQRWLCEDPRGVYLTDTGEPQISLRWPLKWWLEEPDHLDDPLLAALEEARTQFLLLMASKAKFAIFKCARENCGIYYILEKPRKDYKRGAICPQHLKQQGTRAKREGERKAVFETAQKALLRWPSLSKSTRAKYKSDRDYIASKLRDFGVGSKWVTRNLTQIDASGERRMRNAQES